MDDESNYSEQDQKSGKKGGSKKSGARGRPISNNSGKAVKQRGYQQKHLTSKTEFVA